MITSQEVEKQFRVDLNALLLKYSSPTSITDITAEDHFRGYAECGEDIRKPLTFRPFMMVKEISSESGPRLILDIF
jgi:hypothetical protein